MPWFGTMENIFEKNNALHNNIPKRFQWKKTGDSLHYSCNDKSY